MNITSLIVDVRPPSVAAVQRALAGLPGVEVHATTPEGKLVVTVERDDTLATAPRPGAEPDTDTDITATFAAIAAIDGVMSLALVYHHDEHEPARGARDGTDAT